MSDTDIKSQQVFRCEMCMGDCKVNESDISMYDFSTFVRPNGGKLFLCASCSREMEAYIRARRLDFQI